MATIDVDIWQWRLGLPPEVVARLERLLSDDERARAARLLAAADRQGFIAARGRLREILARYAGEAPQSLRFTYGASGKPSLDGAPQFNLSHSGDWAVLAVTPQHAIGVDIECERPLRADLARRYFSAQEVAAIASASVEDQAHAFFRCWTRKEAVVKALGTGLDRPLASFDVSVADEAWPKLTRIEGASFADAARWRIAALAPAAGYAGAVALQVDAADDEVNLVFQDAWPGETPDGLSAGC